MASADASSSLPLILSALGAALGVEQLCIHLLDGTVLKMSGSLGLPPAMLRRMSQVPLGPAGGPIGLAAQTAQTMVDVDGSVAARSGWKPAAGAMGRAGGCYAVPVIGSTGAFGVITVFRAELGRPSRDELDLVTLYAGYAASAVERDRLLGQVTARNRVLETIREVLETLAGPVPLDAGLAVALRALRQGLGATAVALLSTGSNGATTCRAQAGAAGDGADPLDAGRADVGLLGGDPSADDLSGDGPVARLVNVVDGLPPADIADRAVRPLRTPDGAAYLVRTFQAPGGRSTVVARWDSGSPPTDGAALLEDAAQCLRLAFEREEAELAHQQASALRRSQDLQRQFLSRLSHELRTPLTAIRGYASSLTQPDVTWDGESQNRFVARISAESDRLGRLVGDLLDFSAIESGILRLQPDWCDIALVLDAARACLPAAGIASVGISCPADLPAIWADHDRLEQVFLNLMDNALRHNPPGTRVNVTAEQLDGVVAIAVADDGAGMPPGQDLTFDPRGRRGPTAGSGLGLSITKGIVDAHSGVLQLQRPDRGTRFVIRLPIEAAAAPPPERSHDV